MISDLYQEVLSAEPQDLFPEIFTETFYSIPLEPKHLVKVLTLLKESGEDEILSHITSFLKEEYQDFYSNND